MMLQVQVDATNGPPADYIPLPDLGTETLALGLREDALVYIAPICVKSVSSWIDNDGCAVKNVGLVNFLFHPGEDEQPRFGSCLVRLRGIKGLAALANRLDRSTRSDEPLMMVARISASDTTTAPGHEVFTPFRGAVDFMSKVELPVTRARQSTINTIAKKIVGAAKQRAKSDGLPFNLAVEWVEEKIIAGRCEATGVEFDLNNSEFSAERTNPLMPSLDQIKPGAGYTKDNVRVVMWFYNRAKADWSDQTALSMLSKIASAATH